MQLWIDGKMKAQWTVLADTREYTYDINLCTGGHNVDIVYTNDCSTPTVNRNLYVYYLKVGGKMIESDDIGVKYDLGTGNGAFDGLDVLAGTVFMDWDGALRFKINDGYTTTTTTTTSTTTTTMPVNCSMRWWFDNNHPVCNQSQFCGSFAYYGLRTFGTQQQCLDSLNATCTITGDYAPCGQVTLQEVIGLINKWAAGSAELSEVIGLINAYSASN